MELCTIDWLPEANVALARGRAAAAADALLSPDAELRQYWCVDKWKEGITVARRHDGAGSHSFVVSKGDATVVKVCVMRRSLGPDALERFQRAPNIDLIPLAKEVLGEEEFRYQELSFLAWSEGGKPWQGLLFRVDGITSIDLARPQLDVISVGPKSFYLFAQSYHEVTIDPPSLMAVFKMTPMDEAFARKISPDVNWNKAKAEMETIGYPLA